MVVKFYNYANEKRTANDTQKKNNSSCSIKARRLSDLGLSAQSKILKNWIRWQLNAENLFL